MTYGEFKDLATGLLIGDNKLPPTPGVLSGLVKHALTTVAMQAESLHLMTLSTTADILRIAHGDYLIRKPIAPVLDTDVLDIDEELTYAVARYLASYISKDKGGIHVNAADRIIKDYNGKTYEILDQMQVEADYAEVDNLDYTAPSTEWTL